VKFCFWLCLCRVDADNIYELFAEVVQVSAGEYSIEQQYPTDNIHDVITVNLFTVIAVILHIDFTQAGKH